MHDGERKRTKLGDTGEAYDKNGHWFRQVPARGQTGWLSVEHWASENRFRLVAAKSHMRVYRKEVGLGGIWLYTEIKLREGRMRVAAWLEADTLARTLRLFMIGPAMVLEPKGFWGIRAKRTACRMLNELLARFGDAPIVGSRRFHLADWDPTTWLLICFSASQGLIALSATLPTSELRWGLVDDNLLALLKPTGVLMLVAWMLILFYEKVVVRRWETMFPKLVGMLVVFVCVGATGWSLVGPTQMDFVHSRVRYHCVEMRSSAEACQSAINALPEGLRGRLVRTLQPRDSRIR